MTEETRSRLDLAVAVVGMAVRLPGAEHPEQFWRNLCDGVESVTFFSDEELLAAGTPRSDLERPGFVPANAPMPFADCFDAAFFGMSPRDAQLTDPQHRVFLECAWQALEDAGQDPSRLRVPVGVYAGCSFSQYLLKNLYPNRALIDTVGLGEVIGRNVPDALASLVSYKLDLRGASVGVQTACSTSLTAVHLAIQALLAGDCDLALAGGVALTLPQTSGYHAMEGSILSPDGHCRPFDHRAAGTVAGSGAAVVLLKRAAEALADRDPIRALILGSAVNNDGFAKLGYSAPSIDAQAAVVAHALRIADVPPETIGYVEAHGTGTPLGDPVEVAALSKAYGGGTSPRASCALGSVKSNIGHLDAAAGAAGLIKATLAVQHGLIPPTLHVEAANPRLHLDESPFAIADRLQLWPDGDGPRRACVSSLGLGGTNVHLILEEAPPLPPLPASDGEQLVVVSGRTRAALERNVENLSAHLAGHPELALADVAYTLREGRKAFPHRLACVARDRAELLSELDPRSWSRQGHADGTAPVVFVFPGFAGGSLALGPAFHDLVATSSVFRAELERCVAGLARSHGLDLTRWLRPDVGAAALAEIERDQARAAPLIFAIQVALARQWIAWGVQPAAVVGHSSGEYAAAAVAGVLEPEAAIHLLACRGQAMHETAPGAMIAVEAPAGEVEALLPPDWDIAVENAPGLCVASGAVAGAARLEARLAARGARHRRLPVDIAPHSRLMEPILDRFESIARAHAFRAPVVPFVSTQTGGWASGQLAAPRYWTQQLRSPVRFARAAAELLADPRRVYLEIGLGRGMTRLMLQQRPGGQVRAVSSFEEQRASGHPASLLDAAGRLWATGAAVDLGAVAGPEAGRRVPLPAYAFERKRCWIAPPDRSAAVPAVTASILPAVCDPAEAAGDDGPGAFEPPSRPFEKEIVDVWSEFLGVPRIGVTDNFFLLGGSSMILAAVAARLSERVGVNVPLRGVLEAPTPRALAALLERTAALRARDGATPTIPRLSLDEAPLTWAQEHVWTFLAAGADRGALNYTWAIEVSGPLALDVLESALRALADRQEILRTVIVAHGAHVGQSVRSDLAVDFQVTHVHAPDRAGELAEVRRLARADRRRAFDPSSGPLAMVRAIQLGRERHVLVCTASLLVLDGWGSAIFTDEWSELYRAALRGEPPQLRPLPVRYRDLAHWQRRGDGVARIDALVAEFKRRFGDPPAVPRLPPGAIRPPARSFRGAQLCFAVPAPLVERATRLGRSLGEPFGAVARAAFAVLLARWTAAERFLLNTGNSNRTDPELAGLIGFIANGMAFRVDVSGSPTFEEVVQRGRAAMLESLDLQECPLPRLYQEWPSAGRLENPLFCATFLLLTPQPTPPIAFGQARGELLDVRSRDVEEYPLPSREDLWLTLDEEPDGSFAGTLQYDLDVVGPGTAGWLAEAYVAMLAAAVETPKMAVAALPYAKGP